MKGEPQDIGAKNNMRDIARTVLRMAAEKNYEVRLEQNMDHVDLQRGEIAIADDGFILIIGRQKLKVPVEN